MNARYKNLLWQSHLGRFQSESTGATPRPIVFTHSPDDAFAPEFGRHLYAAIRELTPDLPPLTGWPGETERSSRKSQKSLF